MFKPYDSLTKLSSLSIKLLELIEHFNKWDVIMDVNETTVISFYISISISGTSVNENIACKGPGFNFWKGDTKNLH